MRSALLLLAALTCLSGIAFAEANLDSSQRYLAVYLEINDAEHLEQKQDLAGALKDFQDCYDKMNSIHISDPDWETALVIHRLEDCRSKIVEIQLRLSSGKGAISADETLAAIRATYPDTARRWSGTSYSWKTNVAADLFWIGENGAKASAWNDDWVKSNGGADAPDDRNGYSTASHAAKLNPFYVALPFNDLALPDLAKKWVPPAWNRQRKNGQLVSACKDRWVELKNTEGRICFAQWEDAFPPKQADPEYVFGDSSPKVGNKPSILISPAVAEYLGMGGVDDRPAPDKWTIVSWRFVDEANVAPGAWLKYDEQALLYAAMNP